MGSIIVAMPNMDNAKKIGNILKNHGLPSDAYCYLGSETLRKVNELDAGVVICTPKLKDMGYLELLEYLPPYCEMLLITKDPDSFEPYENIVKIAHPFRAMDLVNTVEMMVSRHYRKPKKKPSALSRSKEEQKLIDDAKELLMVRNEMTEPEAFRYIQKNSMDTGRTLIESAQMILMLNCDR